MRVNVFSLLHYMFSLLHRRNALQCSYICLFRVSRRCVWFVYIRVGLALGLFFNIALPKANTLACSCLYGVFPSHHPVFFFLQAHQALSAKRVKKSISHHSNNGNWHNLYIKIIRCRHLCSDFCSSITSRYLTCSRSNPLIRVVTCFSCVWPRFISR